MSAISQGRQPPDGRDLLTGMFAALLEQIARFADDVKLQCADAVLESDFDRVNRLMEALRELDDLRGEVARRAAHWHKGISHPKVRSDDATPRTIGSHSKGSPTRLRVQLAGQTVEMPRAADTFARVLELMGLEQVARLGKRLSATLLVARNPTTGYQSQVVKQGWYITTHANNNDKKRLLEEIAADLKKVVRVEIVR